MAILIALQEELRTDDAVLIQQIRAGVGNTGIATTSVHAFITNAVGIDGLAALVRQQRVGNLVLVRVFLERLHRIVADGYQLKSRGLNLLDVFIQLNQLLFTVGSPIG